MTFAALLTKELRLRLRRERSVIVIIIYLLVMGLLGLFFLNVTVLRQDVYSGNNFYLLSTAGSQLYILLSIVQLFLIMFITPAFTSTSINGEKERQTFDLLLCSRLSGISLISGKLVAGLANAMILIAAAIPLFSLVFFFGGVGPTEFVSSLLVYVASTIVVGTFGLFCSVWVKRPAVSTAFSYVFSVLWLVSPWLLYYMWLLFGAGSQVGNSSNLAWLALNPIGALVATFPDTGGVPFNYFSIGTIQVHAWIIYAIACLIVSVVFFFLSAWLVKPNPMGRLRQFRKRFKTQAPVAVTQPQS